MAEKKSETKVRMTFPCPFCGDEARLKMCQQGSSGPPTYYWRCACNCRGFLDAQTFTLMDRNKKIAFTS